MKRKLTTIEVFARHAQDVLESKTADNPPWKQRHIDAWNNPDRHSERGVKSLLEGFASIAHAYRQTFDSPIESDTYYGEHAREILTAAHNWLNMGPSNRFDSGAISRLICQLATAAGINPDDV